MASHQDGTFHFSSNRLRLALALLVLAALLVGGASVARPPSEARPPWTYGDTYGASLEDEYGNALRTFRLDGSTFVLGHEGERFKVRLHNRGDHRVEAVLSIDGRDAVSGRVADYVHERGYIVPPHGSLLVEGFRTGLESVAAFRFARPSESYSARMGTPENVGIIGVAFFPERREYPRPLRRSRVWPSVRPESGPRSRYDLDDSPASGRPAPQKSPRSGTTEDLGDSRRQRAERGPSAGAAPSRLGTEYGEWLESRVSEVPFQRANPAYPTSVTRLRYDDAEGLRQRGIDVYPVPYWPEDEPAAYPEAFPRNRFAPPPP